MQDPHRRIGLPVFFVLLPRFMETDVADDGHLPSVLDKKKYAGVIKEQSQPNDWISLITIVLQWVIIGGAITIGVISSNWAIKILMMIIIATRQHVLLVLMHEAVHFRLHKSKPLNDWVSQFFLSFPLGVSTRAYRNFHFAHHRYGYTDKDPQMEAMHRDEDFLWPKMVLQSWVVFFKDIFGINIPKMGKVFFDFLPAQHGGPFGPDSKSESFLFLVFVIAVLGICWATGHLPTLLLFWYIPSLTFLTAIFRVRSIAEHECTEQEHELNKTRCVVPNFGERFLISPCGIKYHIEHHMFPSVPWFRLKSLHETLMKDPVFAERAHITRGYLYGKNSLLKEITSRPEPVSSV